MRSFGAGRHAIAQRRVLPQRIRERPEELHYFPNDVPCCLVIQPWRRKPSSRVRNFAEAVDNDDVLACMAAALIALLAPHKALATAPSTE